MTRPDPTDRAPRRAFPHTARLAPLLLAAALAGACGEEATPDGSGPGQAAAADLALGSVEQELRDFVTAMTPPAADATSDVQDDWLRRYRRELRDIERWPRAYGVAALERYRARRDADLAVRIGLLRAAATAAPEEATPVLVSLIVEYGEDLAVREKAPMLFARADPEQAIEVLEPLLIERRPSVTRPPRSTLLDGWLEACRRTGKDPAPTLSLVATDIYVDETTRNLAVRALWDHPGTTAQQALRTVLTESTGNAYLRRRAAQGVPLVFEQAEACALIEEVLGLEADVNMQRFLLDLVEEHCP